MVAPAVVKVVQVAVKADAQVLATPVVMVVVKQLVLLIVGASALLIKLLLTHKWILH